MRICRPHARKYCVILRILTLISSLQMKDISVHRYFGLDDEILWDILQKQIRPILEEIDQILADEALGKS